MSDQNGNHGPDPEPRGTATPMVLVTLITILTIALIFLNRGESHPFDGNTVILGFIGLAANQLFIAHRSERARKRIEEGLTDTRHIVRNALNPKVLQAWEDAEKFKDVIRTIAEEVRKAEREQFWLIPENREQLKKMLKEVSNECHEEHLALIRQYHELHHPHVPLIEIKPPPESI